MPFYSYIIFSSSINKFYIGATSLNLEDRLRRHNSNHQGFTGKANDWHFVWSQAFESKSDAIDKEKQIKKRGAKRFLEDLHK